MSSTTRDDGLGRGDAREHDRGVDYGVRLREPGVRPLGALRVYGVLQRNIANLEFVMTLQEELERFGFPEHCDFWASSATSSFRCSGGTGSCERWALSVSQHQ